jgi:hypothetical protein
MNDAHGYLRGTYYAALGKAFFAAGEGWNEVRKYH